MTKYKTRAEVAEAADAEGLDYFLQEYASSDMMPDAELRLAFEIAENALNHFETLLRGGI